MSHFRTLGGGGAGGGGDDDAQEQRSLLLANVLMELRGKEQQARRATSIDCEILTARLLTYSPACQHPRLPACARASPCSGPALLLPAAVMCCATAQAMGWHGMRRSFHGFVKESGAA
jgi:hypothetical protein